ncbi:kelch-like protein 4 [Podarcis raffonei]|uniref:kelch-like protein 4 n=1 Tax=Podarcis raffonei TaxID=65483 RepID=UPI0023292C6B|nr:kelch-like protein 4 [Podarcis raffonei]
MAKTAEAPREKELGSDDSQSGLLSLKHIIKQGIRQLYQAQLLCDVTLVAEGRKFPCHRTLLASISLYFQRMFTSTFKESREGEIVLMDLTASSLQRLLDYIYTGELLLLSEDVEDLFTAASRLQIMSALEIITRFLMERISMENCLGLYVLAYSHNHRPLLRPASRYIAFHFEHLIELTAFLALDFSVLVSIIASDGLEVDSELTIYRAMRRWVYHNPDERLLKHAALMDHIRLSLLSPEELAEVRAETEEFYECVRLPWEELSVPERLWASRGLRQGMYHKGVVCVGLPKWSKMSLGAEELDSHVHFFDPSTEQWEQLPDLKSLTSPSCVSLGHKLYITGGQHLDGSYSNNLLVYDTLGGHWSKLPPMTTARAWHAFLLCQKRLYAAGGWDSTGTLVCAESYDLEREEWTDISSLPFALTYFASVTLKSKLYLVGGERDDAELPVPHKGFLVYDIKSGAWSQVPMAFEFYEASAVTLGDCIFVVGGLSGEGNEGSRYFTGRCVCLLSDGTVNQELSIPLLPIAISYPGVVCWRKRVYVFGGDSNDRYSSAIHYWEPGQQNWVQCGATLPDPHYGAFGFGCIPLNVPRKNILAVFHRGSTFEVEEQEEDSLEPCPVANLT